MRPQPHPFMANSVSAIQQEMLDAIGAASVAELFEQIPADHLTQRAIALPPALSSEAALRRHLIDTLSQNDHCESHLSFLGGGCWRHHVPAICDEIARRSEFLTSVWGTPSSDQGRYQAWFEFCSQLGELVDCDLVGLPVYTWGCATGHALRMASRLNGRHTVLVPEVIDPERLAVIRNYCEPPEMRAHLNIVQMRFDRSTGRIDLAHLADTVVNAGVDLAAIYLETPNYLGVIEEDANRIAEIAHGAGAEMIVGVDPISLGVLAPPPAYGADIVVGTTQPLGVHMYGGGGLGGFIATRDEERYAREYPTLLVSLTGTSRPGEIGFGLSLAEQSSYGSRENGKDWTGNSVYLWAIANAVYLSLMGPSGLRGRWPVDHGANALRRKTPRRYSRGRGAACRQRVQGIRRRFFGDGTHRGLDQPGVARARHLRRPRPVFRRARAWPKRALLHHRTSRTAGYRPFDRHAQRDPER